jgi:hypothetical protein
VTCIYCLRNTSRSKSVPHALPQALYPQSIALPVGAICDQCNHYAGSNLEPTLVQYPPIALPLQLHAVPGKQGRPRKKLGIFERDIVPNAAVTFATEEPVIATGVDGARNATVRIWLDAKFDMDKFRRALYHAAFNVAAYNRGIDWALSKECDAVRTYVRRPRKNERWTFVQAEHGQASNEYVAVTPVELKGADILRLRIFDLDYFVDLINSGCLDTTKIEPEGAGTVVGNNWKRAEPPSREPGRHYRMSVY